MDDHVYIASVQQTENYYKMNTRLDFKDGKVRLETHLFYNKNTGVKYEVFVNKERDTLSCGLKETQEMLINIPVEILKALYER